MLRAENFDIRNRKIIYTSFKSTKLMRIYQASGDLNVEAVYCSTKESMAVHMRR